MERKSLIWIVGTVITITIILLVIFRLLDRKNNEKISNENQNFVNISSVDAEEQGEVTDSCIDEWEDYNKYLGEKVEEASNNLSSQDTHYIIKNVEGYINVYSVDENNEEILYKKTDISTDYLSEEDVDDLEIGIEVVGTEALNKMLEDFE